MERNAQSDVFDNYFRNHSNASVEEKRINPPLDDKTVYVSKSEESKYDISFIRQMADSNISDIEELANLLKKLCNAAWGLSWGELSPDLKGGDNLSVMTLPQITIEVNHKEISEGMPLKPVLFETIREKDGTGNYTGESFLMYRQFFDYNIEFNIYGETSKDARELNRKFQQLISVYTGYIKQQGVSEIFFESQDTSKVSLNYQDNLCMIPVYYYVRMEQITVVRKTNIDRINALIGVGRINIDKLETVLGKEASSTQTGDLDAYFFTQEDE